MTTALAILLAQGVLGAFDTLWYHEWRARLPTRPGARRELRLHAARDLVYAVLFVGLAFWRWQGWLAAVLVVLLATEIAITLLDFVEEDRRRPLPAGERVTHALMGILYGAFLAHALPVLWDWWHAPTGLAPVERGALGLVLAVMGAGVALSGARDWTAAAGVESD